VKGASYTCEKHPSQKKTNPFDLIFFIIFFIIFFFLARKGCSQKHMEENRQTRDECFRVLRPDEVDALAQVGLVAKNKDEKGASVAEHIRNGSTRGYKSQYISTTGSLECACKFAGMFQQIARVVLPP
jgi:hypothetical protein